MLMPPGHCRCLRRPRCRGVGKSAGRRRSDCAGRVGAGYSTSRGDGSLSSAVLACPPRRWLGRDGGAELLARSRLSGARSPRPRSDGLMRALPPCSFSAASITGVSCCRSQRGVDAAVKADHPSSPPSRAADECGAESRDSTPRDCRAEETQPSSRRRRRSPQAWTRWRCSARDGKYCLLPQPSPRKEATESPSRRALVRRRAGRRRPSASAWRPAPVFAGRSAEHPPIC